MKPESARYLRISLTLGGCSGFIHGLDFAEEFNPEHDIVEHLDGISNLIDKKCATHLRGATLDFITTEAGTQGFTFDNPNKPPLELPPQEKK